MTLTRTIRRREKRKRAKARAARWASGPRISFASCDWLVRDHLASLASTIKAAKCFSREYK